MADAIKFLSISHEAIMDYLMGHPSVRLGDVAAHFGYSAGWLSQIIHSDIFQTRLKEKTDIAFHHTVLPLREKMQAAASMAMDKIIENLPNEPDLRTVSSVAEGMLDRLGFSSKPITPGGNLTINQQNNFVSLPNTTRDEIAEARKMLEARAQPLGVGVTVNGESLPISLPRESVAVESEALPESHLPFAPWKDEAGKAGTEVRSECASEASAAV